MEWHYSDRSDDDLLNDSQQTSRKRSSRACDQCRKTKSKCERSSEKNLPCKSCSMAGTACTFLGPSYKRGPPKGYIHAIEQRWHQVEALLGAIIQCPDPQVQALVSALSQDDLAREIIQRVDDGPYGPSGRRSQPDGATKEDFFASILRSHESGGTSRDSARSRRQSRVSREIVSSTQDNGLSVLPTMEWQDNLSDYLASTSETTLDVNNDHSRSVRRRRLDPTVNSAQVYPDWNEMYTMEPEPDDLQDTLDAIGGLALDENKEVRYHGQSSGLHILSRNVRTDDRHIGGLWRLPMARVWPAAGCYKDPQQQDPNTSLPPIYVQDRLVDLYFNYVHPMFPVLHKTRFLVEFNSRRQNIRPVHFPESPIRDTSQEITPLLLFSIFALTARFCEDETPPPPKGKMWEAGCNYLDTARALLTRDFHQSRISTVQSLLLLGYREFGIGSMEQAWLFSGMAIRMATDLGLNCDSSTWKIQGQNLFSPTEIQMRCQIWWSCCIADRYGSLYLGRPIVIKDNDFETPLPSVDSEEDQTPWPSVSKYNLDHPSSSMPGLVSSCTRAFASLTVVAGAIVTQIYPVRRIPLATRKTNYAETERRLDQWFISLPDHLRYEATSRRSIPAPHVLFLHIRYWGAVLLLNRAFIPNWKGAEPTSRNTLELKAFDLAQGAASHISSIATTYRETFTLKRTSPFLTPHVLAAGIMHLVTLTLRPSNVQASLGLKQCMAALKDMEMVWPCASRAWELLNGVKMGSENTAPPPSHAPDRHKRPAEAAFGKEKSSDYLQGEAFNNPSNSETTAEGRNGVHALGTRIMAHMLGLNIPGVEPSTSYYPGYEWWPRSYEETPPSSHQMSPSPSDLQNVLPPINVLPSSSRGLATSGGVTEWSQGHPPYTYDFERYRL